MRHVMRCDEQSRHVAETGFQLFRQARLGAEQGATGGHKLSATFGRDGDGILHHAIERQQRVVIEHHRIELCGLDEAFAETVVDGTLRKARVVLFARKALLLRGSYDLAVADQGRCGIVVKRRDPEHVRHVKHSHP